MHSGLHSTLRLINSPAIISPPLKNNILQAFHMFFQGDFLFFL